MEWTLNPETDLTPYGVTHLLDLQELLGDKESATIQADGTIRLTIPDAHVKEALTNLYESSPALQNYLPQFGMEREAFLQNGIAAFREGFTKGINYTKLMMDLAKTEQKNEVAYQEFCKMPGVTEDQKRYARFITDQGIEKNDWASVASHLQNGTMLPHYGELLESMNGKGKTPLDAYRDAVNDLVDICKIRDSLAEIRNSIYLNDPKMDQGAAMAASICIFEPGIEFSDLAAELDNPDKRGAYRKEALALCCCVDRLIELYGEAREKLNFHPDEITKEDLKELIVKTNDPIRNYDYAHLREGYDLAPVHPFQMGKDEDQGKFFAVADTIDTLRNRSEPNPKASPAEKAMYEVFCKYPNNFDYRQLTMVAVANLMEKGASNKTLKEAVAIGQDICPSIGKTKDILKAAEKRHQDITLNAGR